GICSAAVDFARSPLAARDQTVKTCPGIIVPRFLSPDFWPWFREAADGMEYFVQQLINGITLGSIYGLIAIGYTMVYGIIGMINFAHGDVFMVSAFIALIAYLILTAFIGISSIALALLLV